MHSLRQLFFSALFCLLSIIPAFSADPDVQPQTTFRADTSVVVVDVVALDEKGEPIPNLKREDFTLFENGKPQTARYFDVNFAERRKSSPAPVELPPNQFTNLPAEEPGRAVNIVLIDKLNTSTLDQINAKKAILKYLTTLPKGERVALFVMGSTLQMVQGFTDNSETLIAVAEQLLASKSPLFTTETERQQDADRDLYMTRQGVKAPPQSRQALFVNGQFMSIYAYRLLASLEKIESYQVDLRARMTLNSLEALAGAVSGYSGRKNLLWLSGNFPFRIGPDFTQDRMSEYRNAIQQTSARLAAAQIAVYPIDVRGLYSRGIDITSNAEGEEPFVGVNSVQAEQKIGRRQGGEIWETHSTMTDIARQTGGEAFWGSNDLTSALGNIIHKGASYYTLAYTPTNQKWDGTFRTIEVKLNRPGARITYRRGYYAVRNQQLAGDQAARLLAAAIQPSVPESTAVAMRVRVSGHDSADGVIKLDYVIDPANVSFVDSEGGKSVRLDFMVVAFAEGRNVTQVADTLEGTLPQDKFESVVKTGIPARQELKLAPGRYLLRVGVIDRNSTRIGTLDVPVEIGPAGSTGS